MPGLATSLSKLRWSLAQRGLGGTLRYALLRASQKAPDQPRPDQHPFDQRYGVDTSGLIGGGELRSGHKHDLFNTAYYGMAPSRFRWVMQSWIDNLSPSAPADYTFIDLGCGKGRAVMMATEFGFRQAIGVELHASLAAIAEANAVIWAKAGRTACPIQILCQDATEFVFPQGPSLLYLFNPFTAPVMKRLIQRIEADFAARPGMLDLLYFNPEAAGLLDVHPGFELLWTGTMAMSEEDAAVDWVASPEDLCSIYRWVGSNGK
jgi:SAM-dependent methyltransferase